MVIDTLILYRDNECSRHTRVYIILSLTIPLVYGITLLYSKWDIVNDIYIMINYELCIWGLLEYFALKHCHGVDILYTIVIVLYAYQIAVWVMAIVWLIQVISAEDGEYNRFDDDPQVI